MRITSDGKVGIGTTNPGFNLDVQGSGTPTLCVRNTSASADAMIHVGEPNTTAYGLQIKWAGAAGRVYFDNRYNHATNPYMYFRMRTSSGSNMVTALSLGPAGQAWFGGAVQLSTYGSGTHTGTSAYKLSVDSSGNVIETAIGAGAVDGAGTANYVAKWTDGDTIGNSVVRDDGTNVGIGTTGNGYKLRVQGNVYVSGTLTEASSLAIKENIETYSPSLEKINKIRPVRYNKKKSNKKEVGLVAEELAEMFPELVETDEKGNPSGVNYSRAVAVLLHGFKELYKEVKELKEKI
jgi:hypothetical protein